MTDKNYDDHPCFACARNGEGGAYMDFPIALRIKCSVDGHSAIDIIGTKHTLDTLYEKCPKNKEESDIDRGYDDG